VHATIQGDFNSPAQFKRTFMSRILVFNGDADGICAAHQLRLAGYAPDQVVTGVKRDIALLERVRAGAGDSVVVADISLDSNRAALLRLLAQGARITWHDHHYAGEIPAHAGLTAHIDTAQDACSSLIVDRLLNGRYAPWAVAAAFGDNLHAVAARAARACGLGEADTAALRELGELVNYNAYGETEADLHLAPARLFERVAPYADPREFIAADDLLTGLRAGFAADMGAARAIAPLHCGGGALCYRLPDAPWSRRVNGVFANELARAAPQRAHAVLVERRQAGAIGYTVSVRAPDARPVGADALCRQFPQGGGRGRAAGINWLPAAELERFSLALAVAFP
jgi:hypothetical protein